jgi:hypothetical protein
MNALSVVLICKSIKPVSAFTHYNVPPEKRMGGYGVRLMKACEQLCHNRKVVEINFGINSADNASELALLGQFATKLGYAVAGENHSKSMAAHA